MTAGSRTLKAMIACCLFLILSSAPLWAQGGTTTRISMGLGGVQANSHSLTTFARGSISADDRFSAFFSSATNLVAGDTNLQQDAFVLDRVSGVIELVSKSTTGALATGSSSLVLLSRDGRLALFSSSAVNLVPSDTNQAPDIFRRDRQLGTTDRVSLTWTGAQADAGASGFRISRDANEIAFESESTNLVPNDTNALSDVFVRECDTGLVARVSVSSSGAEGNSLSVQPDISSDGRLVTFVSNATNLVPNDNNGWSDVFLHDRQTGQTSRVSLSSAGLEANGPSGVACISGNGRFVAFSSSASNLVPGDTNTRTDIFVRDLSFGTTVRVSVSSSGVQANIDSEQPCISDDGMRITFGSTASNLVPGVSGQQVFLRDQLSGTTTLISQSTAGAQSNSFSLRASIAGNGRTVMFQSDASNLVPGDTNNLTDVFLRELPLTPPIVYCPAKPNSAGCWPAIASSGTASATSPQAFTIQAAQVLNGRRGLLLYSTTSSNLVPFTGGWLCISAPIRRTSGLFSGGTPLPANDCSGIFAFDFNARIRSGLDPLLGVGASVWAQFYSRDPGFPAPDNTGLTNAIAFEIGS